MAFFGNPNLNVSGFGVNTSGGIACSRTSGLTPMFIHVSASAITATGTRTNGNPILPYEDLHYEWNFGDASGTESVINPCVSLPAVTAHGARNPNTDQIGPEAFYVYRNAGDFTITLTIKDSAGSTIASVTQIIHVTAWSGTDVYFDSNAAGGGNGSIGTPYNDLATLNSTINGSTNIRANIKCGSVWTVNNPASPVILMQGPNPISGLRIQSYSTGAKPRFVTTGTKQNNNSVPYAAVNNWGPNVSVSQTDVVISNLVFEQQIIPISDQPADGVSCYFCNAGESGGGAHPFEHIYNDSCELIINIGNVVNNGALYASVGSKSTTDGEGLLHYRGFWNCRLAGSCNIGCYEEATKWYAHMGTNFDNVFSLNLGFINETQNHYAYPNTEKHQLWRWCLFTGGDHQSYVWNGNWNDYSDTQDRFPEFFLFSENNMRGVSYGLDGGGSEGFANRVKFRNVVMQANDWHDMRDGGIFVAGSEFITYTARDNRFWNVPCGAIGGFQNQNYQVETSVYRNKKYDNGTQSANAVPNNMGVLWDVFLGGNPDWTTKQTITDNIVVNTATHPSFIGIGNTTHNFPTGSVIDRNQYFGPNTLQTNMWLDTDNGSPNYTFSQWQGLGWDSSGSYANPSWNNPAVGDFTIGTHSNVPLRWRLHG